MIEAAHTLVYQVRLALHFNIILNEEFSYFYMMLSCKIGLLK